MGFKGGGQSCSSDSRPYECATNRPMTQEEIARIRERSELDRGKSQGQLLEEAMARARATNARNTDSNRKGGFRKTKRRSTKRRSTRKRR
jgi:predicted Zn-dependent protease